MEVTTDDLFGGPDGEGGLLDLIECRLQLVVQHVMYGPDWDLPCRSCSAAAVENQRANHVVGTNGEIRLAADHADDVEVGAG